MSLGLVALSCTSVLVLFFCISLGVGCASSHSFPGVQRSTGEERWRAWVALCWRDLTAESVGWGTCPHGRLPPGAPEQVRRPWKCQACVCFTIFPLLFPVCTFFPGGPGLPPAWHLHFLPGQMTHFHYSLVLGLQKLRSKGRILFWFHFVTNEFILAHGVFPAVEGGVERVKTSLSCHNLRPPVLIVILVPIKSKLTSKWAITLFEMELPTEMKVLIAL